MRRDPATDPVALEPALGYRFRDAGLLELALTHRSISPSRNNERLEFLGDSVLGHLVAAELFHRFPAASEGALTRARARLVREETLAELARGLALGDFLRLGPAELKSGAWRRASILADAVEAILGAVYLDGGLDACAGCVQRWYAAMLDDPALVQLDKDAKTRLQEWLQGRGHPLPSYDVIETRGPEHARWFRVRCSVPALALLAEAEGASRRIAEQESAASLLQQIVEQGA